ncbi:MAG: hypothetical protein ACOZCL_05790 [Bacillota bacterium]
MSMRHAKFTNIKGNREEFAAELILPQDRHFHREAKSQKTQLQSRHKHGAHKGIKVPIKRKMT